MSIKPAAIGKGNIRIYPVSHFFTLLLRTDLTYGQKHEKIESLHAANFSARILYDLLYLPVHRIDAISMALYRRAGRQGIGDVGIGGTVFLCRTDDGADGFAVGYPAGSTHDVRQFGRTARIACHQGYGHIAVAGSETVGHPDPFHLGGRILFPEQCSAHSAGQDVDTALFGKADLSRTGYSRRRILRPDTGI